MHRQCVARWQRGHRLNLLAPKYQPCSFPATMTSCFHPRRSERAASLMPAAQVEMIVGAGHSAYFEQPEAFSAALEAFLAGLP